MFIADTDTDARRLLQRLLLEMGLSADLDELDRPVAADPAFLQELKARVLRYLRKKGDPAAGAVTIPLSAASRQFNRRPRSNWSRPVSRIMEVNALDHWEIPPER